MYIGNLIIKTQQLLPHCQQMRTKYKTDLKKIYSLSEDKERRSVDKNWEQQKRHVIYQLEVLLLTEKSINVR